LFSRTAKKQQEKEKLSNHRDAGKCGNKPEIKTEKKVRE